MKTLSIDLETYSNLDIKQAGGYKYAENAEILLFGCAYDDEAVQVFDLAQGEQIPDSIIYDLTNPTVLKTAYNAQFERTVLSHYLGLNYFLDPSQWQCTMVLALNLGLYGSLAEDCKVFKLDEDKAKMNIGRKLIMEFCRPCTATKANGGRIRNMPTDDMENWKLFIEYNRRDVEVERYLRHKMLAFKPNDFEQRLWCLDQQINDRGIGIDTKLVDKAILVDTDFKKRTAKQAKEISGLNNPNSTEQLKKWIEDNEGFFPASLTKISIDELLKMD